MCRLAWQKHHHDGLLEFSLHRPGKQRAECTDHIDQGEEMITQQHRGPVGEIRQRLELQRCNDGRPDQRRKRPAQRLRIDAQDDVLVSAVEVRGEARLCRRHQPAPTADRARHPVDRQLAVAAQRKR
ncbi:MAG: hypothetical protein P8Y53_09455 [Pseudolabrys sp.]